MSNAEPTTNSTTTPPPTSRGRILFLFSALSPWAMALLAYGAAKAQGDQWGALGTFILGLIAAGVLGLGVFVAGLLVVWRNWQYPAWRWTTLALTVVSGMLPTAFLVYLVATAFFGR